MSQAIAVLTLTAAAAGAITSRRFVAHDRTQAGAGVNALGVARSDAETDDDVSIDVLGTAVVEAGAAISAGAEIETDANGRAITFSAGKKVARLAPGQSASAAGEFVEVILIPN